MIISSMLGETNCSSSKTRSLFDKYQQPGTNPVSIFLMPIIEGGTKNNAILGIKTNTSGYDGESYNVSKPITEN